MFQELSEDSDAYKKFYEAFGKNLKLGIHEDSANRASLAKLLRYPSSKTGDDNEITSLEDYVARMPEKQKDIYYITGESIASIAKSPFMEKLNDMGYEVLYMTDPIDEYAVQQLKEFDGKKLVCITKEKLELDESDDAKDAFKNASEKAEKLCKFMKETLVDKIEKVVVSSRLGTSPCCLVTGEYGWTANMERIMKAQALRDSSMSMHMASKKTMEINPANDIVGKLIDTLESEDNQHVAKDLVWLLYETSLLSSGFTLDEPTTFTTRIHRLIRLGLRLDIDDDKEEYEDLPEIDTNDATEKLMDEVD